MLRLARAYVRSPRDAQPKKKESLVRCPMAEDCRQYQEAANRKVPANEQDCERDVLVLETPGNFRRIFSHWSWRWSFCPVPSLSMSKSQHTTHDICQDETNPPSMSKSPDTTQGISQDETTDEEDDDSPRETINSDAVPIIRQTPSTTVHTGCGSHDDSGHPTIVYICNPPISSKDDRPTIAARLVSVGTLTVSGDEASDDDDDGSYDNLPPRIPRNAPPRPPRPTVNRVMRRPVSMRSRTLTAGSATTTSSRHRRMYDTISPASLRRVYSDENGDDDISEASPFPELGSDEWNEKDCSFHTLLESPPEPKQKIPQGIASFADQTDIKNDCTLNARGEQWMHQWASGGGRQETQMGEKTPVKAFSSQEIALTSKCQRFEPTYLPRCSSMDHSNQFGGSTVLFAGWLVYSKSGNIASPPSHKDIVYMVLLENIPKIHFAKGKGDQWTMLHVSPKARVHSIDISKSHGKGVVVHDGDEELGTFLPISLPCCFFRNKSLIDDDEFDTLAYNTMAPFHPRPTSSQLNFDDTEHYREYAPVSQQEAAMHLLFTMDSWRILLSRRR